MLLLAAPSRMQACPGGVLQEPGSSENSLIQSTPWETLKAEPGLGVGWSGNEQGPGWLP